jgi:hypothetical protein
MLDDLTDLPPSAQLKLARDILWHLVVHFGRQLEGEEGADSVDVARVDWLREVINDLSSRRQRLAAGDLALARSVLIEHGPVLVEIHSAMLAGGG